MVNMDGHPRNASAVLKYLVIKHLRQIITAPDCNSNHERTNSQSRSQQKQQHQHIYFRGNKELII